MRELPPGVREGEIFAGKYQIGKVLDSGAMGTVVAAHHLSLDQKVAIKFLRSEALSYVGSVERLVREARATARIRSEHVVRVFDVHGAEAGIPYIVMEYLQGRDLAAWLRERGPLPVAQAVDFVLEACEALAEAHDLGIVHRDLKPANLFAVEPPGAPPYLKVLDFGISKTLVAPTLAPGQLDASVALTEDRAIMGSLHYMSPEQMESARDVDGRTDIWALGVILCELVTGKPPFGGQSVPQVYFNIVSRPLQRVASSVPVPPGLESIILKCLEPAREKRYGSVPDLAIDLAAFRSSDEIVLAKYAAAGRASATQSGDTLRAMTPSPRLEAEKTLASSLGAVAGHSKRTRPRRFVLPAVLAATLAVAAVGFVVRSSHVVSAPEGPPRLLSGRPAATSQATLVTQSTLSSNEIPAPLSPGRNLGDSAPEAAAATVAPTALSKNAAGPPPVAPWPPKVSAAAIGSLTTPRDKSVPPPAGTPALPAPSAADDIHSLLRQRE